MNVKIFTDNIDEVSLEQVNHLRMSKAFEGATIRIMPDVHAGKGSVVGFTSRYTKHIIPNVIGVDIGCGVAVVELGKIDIDYKKLDNFIRANIPHGFSVREYALRDFHIDELRCYQEIVNPNRILRSLGTLGGGNHFIEIDEDDEQNKYLIIHSGSRNLGKQVADYYQWKAVQYQKSLRVNIQDVIDKLKREGRQQEIEEHIVSIKKEQEIDIDYNLAYLSEEDEKDYLHDMRIAQEFAVENRKEIAKLVVRGMGWKKLSYFETVHNYYNFNDNIIRKGAISAYKGEKVIIPLNMRDGCIIALGKGNEDWNYSAPHGAGRIMSRNEAKKLINLKDFQETMEGIYSTSINESTLDEAPFAYKDSGEIIKNITDTVKIIKLLKPVYNFKAQ
ncbi:MAG: RtcB family protein [Acholeplasmataceae bacterium]|nr:RtcB family protein [Acholeplasmataceae bacterium]